MASNNYQTHFVLVFVLGKQVNNNRQLQKNGDTSYSHTFYQIQSLFYDRAQTGKEMR